jgi:hypothetical protein
MGKHSKGGSGQTAQQASYGGQTMAQADADAKYKADMAAWRAPTTQGTGHAGVDTGVITADAPTSVGDTGHLGVPTTNWAATGLGGYGPALPAAGVLPTAPVAVQRNSLASAMQPTGYGTAWSPYSAGSNSGGGYQMRSGPTFSSLSRGGSR